MALQFKNFSPLTFTTSFHSPHPPPHHHHLILIRLAAEECQWVLKEKQLGWIILAEGLNRLYQALFNFYKTFNYTHTATTQSLLGSTLTC